MPRIDGRAPDQIRSLKLTPGWSKNAEGSCLVECGETRVLCTATVENNVPIWMRGGGTGWITAEYSMLPRATTKRNTRDASRGRPDGRTIEIQRLIGRTLRAAVNMKTLGERTIILDCDVLQADGGTRTASINGAWVALRQAIDGLRAADMVRGQPVQSQVAAISVGIVGRQELLDLCYEEDARATLDMNVVMNEQGRLLEVQAGGEGQSFTRAELGRMLELAKIGIDAIMPLQIEAVREN